MKREGIYGLVEGIGKRKAPHARVTSYKVCYPECYELDIIAAFDPSIHDGVDLFSISLRSVPPCHIIFKME